MNSWSAVKMSEPAGKAYCVGIKKEGEYVMCSLHQELQPKCPLEKHLTCSCFTGSYSAPNCGDV